MEKIFYKVNGYISAYNYETETEEQVECLVDVERLFSEANEEIAKREAYNGKYTIEDDGVKETPALTLENRVESLETETSDLSEAIELLLSGVTE